MPKHWLPYTASGLTLIILLLTAVLFPEVPAHSFYHATHDNHAQTESLCNWLCTSGELLDTNEAPFRHFILLSGTPDPKPSTSPMSIWKTTSSSRAPPSLRI